MKRIVFLILASVLGGHLCAQTDAATTLTDSSSVETRETCRVPGNSIGQFNWAAMAGVGFSTVRAKSNSEISSNFLIGKKSTVNYRVGALVDYTCYANLFLEGGLFFQHKGYRIVNELGGEDEEDYSVRLYYLHVPLSANYRFSIEKIWLAPQLGPYFDVALFGKQKGFERNEGVKKDYNEDIFDDIHKDTYRRFDCGILIGLNGFFKNYRVGMEFDLGIVNMYKKVLGTQPEIRHTTFSFNFAYYFR